MAPFAEERNETRRLAALQARGFAAAGFTVLQIDLLGCGDSSGYFGDPSWVRRLDDLQLAHAWLAERAPGPDPLWGVRASCLLAAELGSRLNTPCIYLFWQSLASGKQLLQQFLRLKRVGDALEGSAQGKGSADALKHSLLEGVPVEVVSYRHSPQLTRGLAAGTLNLRAQVLRLAAFELSTREGALLSPVPQRLVDAWRQAGAVADAQVVSGPAFWQTTETEDAPALLTVSLRALQHG